MVKFFLRIKFKTFLYLIIIVFLLLIFINQWSNQPVDNIPKIIWWTPFTKNDDLSPIYCGDYECGVTDNRKYFNVQDPSIAFIFYASNFQPCDLPLPRTKDHIWAIVHEESPKNLALFLHNEGQKLFNFTSTFSRYSHVPLTLQYLPSIKSLSDTKYFLTTKKKNVLLKNLSPILYIQSDCETPLERSSYVLELMKYVSVDSYGKCLNNKKLPERFRINPLEDLYENDFMHFVAQYKFIIAFENAECDDYITEKLWRALIAGSIPIYMGSPTVMDWLPNNNSAILAKTFATPKMLAKYILELNSKDSIYDSYLQHKLSKKITNKRLLAAMETRSWGYNTDENFFSTFQCYVCENMHKRTKNNIVDKTHYNCPEPISPLSGTTNVSNWWIDHWKQGKCQGKVLNDFVRKYNNFTQTMFDNEVMKLREEQYC